MSRFLRHSVLRRVLRALFGRRADRLRFHTRRVRRHHQILHGLDVAVILRHGRMLLLSQPCVHAVRDQHVDQCSIPAKPKMLAAIVIDASTQKPEMPTVLPRIFGPMTLPSSCCKTITKMTK